MNRAHAGARGFSLLELSLIILVLGLLTPLAWKFIAARLAQDEQRVSYSLLEEADWALTGYAMANARLPCPDTDGDGDENCGGADETGALPYRTLGIADHRARQVRYGVLRRDDAVADPEAVADDPVPALPRAADLTVKMDRFYPFFAFFSGADSAVDSLKDLPDLETNASPTPVEKGGAMIVSANVPLGKVTTLDFCAALRIADDPPPADASGHLHVADRQVAYALALPGDLPDPADPLAHPPSAPQTWTNDARSRAVSLATLWQRLECGEAMASIGHAHPNAATASLMLYRSLFDYEQVQQQAVELAEVGILIATSQVVSAAAAVIDAVAAGLHAAGDVAKAFGGAPQSIAAAVLMAATAAVQVPLAGMSLESAIEARDMTEQRFVFVKGLRDTARDLAQEIVNNALWADEQEPYEGQ